MFKHLCFSGWHKFRRFGVLGKWSLASGSGCLGGRRLWGLQLACCLRSVPLLLRASSLTLLPPQPQATPATTSPSPQQTAPHPKPRILPHTTPSQVCGRTHKKTENAPLLAAARFAGVLATAAGGQAGSEQTWMFLWGPGFQKPLNFPKVRFPHLFILSKSKVVSPQKQRRV